MKCLGCRHGALRDPRNPQRDTTLRQMAKRGLVNCLKSQCRASFIPWSRDIKCDLFQPTDEPTRLARQKYFEGL